jgi:hypothetical protein
MGAWDTALGTYDHDLFVAKFDVNGGLIYSTFIGGDYDDIAHDIDVDRAGNAYIAATVDDQNCGEPLEPPCSFPLTAGAYDVTFGNHHDGAVVKLNATGSALVFSTFLGGGGNDYAFGVAVDSEGRATVCGSTTSFQTTLVDLFPIFWMPGTTPVVETTASPPVDQGGPISVPFVTKFRADGAALGCVTK